ncbi:MAG: hypothetical protein HYV09_02780 [Deltaproteobacteria bacterium]|nr:hypothetical protein [Deltaproteobacteria bacterium]
MSCSRAALLLASLAVAACAPDEHDCRPSFQQVDAARDCLLPLLAEPCFESPGPPSTACSVTTDGKVYVSRDGRLFPGARACTEDEAKKYSSLPSCA